MVIEQVQLVFMNRRLAQPDEGSVGGIVVIGIEVGTSSGEHRGERELSIPRVRHEQVGKASREVGGELDLEMVGGGRGIGGSGLDGADRLFGAIAQKERVGQMVETGQVVQIGRAHV